MSDARKRNIIICVLKLFNEKKVELSKILIHKFMYFLDVQGVRAGLSFEPYTYGPFSFDLTRELESMVFWDEITEEKNYYRIKNFDDYVDLTSDENKKIEELYDKFSTIADNNFDFKTVEIIGTVLYCANSLKNLDEKVDEPSVIKCFNEWKPEKYSDREIAKFYNKMEKIISIN